MLHVERLWTDEEILAMPATIDLLRKMRSAAVCEPSFYLRSRRTLNHLLGGQEEIHPSQEALSHAEELADAAGDFFAAKISKTTRRKTEYEKWQDLLSDGRRQYRIYGASTYAKTSLGEVASAFIGRLRSLHIDPRYTLEWQLLKNNNLGVDSIERLVNKNMGVISPLSGDYVMARVYSSYLRRTRGRSFPTHAAALSRDLLVVTLPVNAGGSPVFEDKSVIGIYIDTTETGNTARALFKHLQTIYPQKEVHEPRFETVEFTRSQKEERYWAERE